MKPNRIPIEPFRTVVREFAERLEMGDTLARDQGTYSPFEAIAEWSGVNYHTLWVTVNTKRRESVDFDFADSVITATVGPNAWRSHPELAEQYQQVDLADELYCSHGVVATRDQRRIDVCAKCAHAFERSARIRRRKRERLAAAA